MHNAQIMLICALSQALLAGKARLMGAPGEGEDEDTRLEARPERIPPTLTATASVTSACCYPRVWSHPLPPVLSQATRVNLNDKIVELNAAIDEFSLEARSSPLLSARRGQRRSASLWLLCAGCCTLTPASRLPAPSRLPARVFGARSWTAQTTAGRPGGALRQCPRQTMQRLLDDGALAAQYD